MSSHDNDDDEYEVEDEDTDESDEGEDEDEDGEENFEQVEADYRRHRAVIRACDDLDELRRVRGNLQSALSAGRVTGAARVRVNDLIEAADERITDVKAKRLAARRS